MSKILVGCKYPNGLMIEHNKVQVKLNGWRNALIQTEEQCGYTEVDEAFYLAWYAENKGKTWCAKGFVFAEVKESNVKAKAKELAKEKTGLEPMKKQDPVKE